MAVLQILAIALHVSITQDLAHLHLLEISSEQQASAGKLEEMQLPSSHMQDSSSSSSSSVAGVVVWLTAHLAGSSTDWQPRLTALQV